MVILRLSTGIANEMLEYAAAYELAKKLNTELVLDLCGCRNDIRPYVLDYLAIPKCKKYIYDYAKTTHGHYEPIPEEVSRDYLMLLQPGIADESEIIEGKSCFYDGVITQEIIDAHNAGRDLYLNGYFIGARFLNRHKKEIYSFFRIREALPELEEYLQKINSKVSVGVHIRRGDMMFASFAQSMEDSYYCAGVQFFRKRFPGCHFYIFSDDKVYVKNLFREQDDIDYVSFVGFDAADMMELICLANCDHHVLSNSSTYSRLAAELSEQDRKDEHIVLMQGDTVNTYQSFRRVLSEIKWKIKGFLSKEKNIRSEISFTSDLVKKYYARYNRRGTTSQYKQTLELETAEKVECSFERIKILYSDRAYDRVLEIAYSVYDQLSNNVEFRKMYIESLESCGYYKEAELEAGWNVNRDVEVVILGQERGQIFGCESYEMRLARAIGHMGYSTLYVVVDDIDETSDFYLTASKGSLFRNCAGITSSFSCIKRADFSGYCESEDRQRCCVTFSEELHDKYDNSILLKECENNDVRIIDDCVDWSFSHRIDDWIVDIALEVDKMLNCL